jgi:hypothetical protein
MAKSKYTVIKSNYTLRNRRQNINKGTIYERDYAVTNTQSSWDDGVFPYGESNFKLTRRYPENGIRKHSFGDWLKQDVCITDDNNGQYWTLNCITDDANAKNENEIILKPNYGSMLDFAYYGSCADLLRVSLDNIINNFPAELFIKDSGIEYYDDAEGKTVKLGSTNIKDVRDAQNDASYNNPNNLSILNITEDTAVCIENPFDLNLTRTTLPNSSDVNELRYFCSSANKYDILNSNDTLVACACDWHVIYRAKACKNGQLTAIIALNNVFDTESNGKPFVVFEYYLNKRRFLLCHKKYAGYKIRPTKKIISDFFDGLDDFEKLLLNQNSNPIFTCTIDYPHETEKGIFSYKKQFTWPTIHDWNLDISSVVYADYVNGLLEIAEFYDNGYANNLWNMMIHDSIKNMDLTYTKQGDDNEQEDFATATSRIEGIMKAIARQFDDIKRSIDNIQYVNSITYNQFNNLPDYFLTDSLEMSGWEVYSSVSGLNSDVTVTSDYAGEEKEYTLSDVNTNFMRCLKLNSKDILRRKGTKESIEMILGLFGLRSYDFERGLYNNLSNSEKCTSKALNSQKVYNASNFEKASFVLNPTVGSSYVDKNAVTTIGSAINIDVERGDKITIRVNGGRLSYVLVDDNGTVVLYRTVSNNAFVTIPQKGHFIVRFSNISVPTVLIIHEYRGKVLTFDALSAGTSENVEITDLYDYKIDEFVQVAKGGESGLTYNSNGELSELEIEKWNSTKLNYTGDDNGDTLEGLPCAMVYFTSGDTDYKYIIPWFKNTSELDGHPYFQMYGGWGKMYKKAIENSLAPNLDTIYGSDDGYEKVAMSSITYGDVFTFDTAYDSISGSTSGGTSQTSTRSATFYGNSGYTYDIINPNAVQFTVALYDENEDVVSVNTSKAKSYRFEFTQDGEQAIVSFKSAMQIVSLNGDVLSGSTYVKNGDILTVSNVTPEQIVEVAYTDTLSGIKKTASLSSIGVNQASYVNNNDTILVDSITIDGSTTSLSDLTVKVGDSAFAVKTSYYRIKPIKGITLYDESLKYINIVRTISDLTEVDYNKLNGGDVFYVFDISDYEENYGETLNGTISHYFILNDKNNLSQYGYNESTDTYGWENIPVYDIENGENNGLRVLYLESIVDDYKANAPHVGYGNYDNGEEFLDYFRTLLKYSITEDNFNDSAYACEDGALSPNISNIGFELTEQLDNMKCWYFTDTAGGNRNLLKVSSENVENGKATVTLNNKTYSVTSDVSQDSISGKTDSSVNVGVKNANTSYTSELSAYNYENGKTDDNDEAAANSVINTKRIRIQFVGEHALADEFRPYLYSSILPYIKQVIPSTAILEISILGEEATFTSFNTLKAVGLAEDEDVLIARYNKS